MNHLLVAYLCPHKKVLVVLAVLLLAQAIGTLYLPNLNADIINDGVVTGDTGYIMLFGALMLAISGLLGVASIVAVYYGARTAMRFGRDVRADLFRRGGYPVRRPADRDGESHPARASTLDHNAPHTSQHQPSSTQGDAPRSNHSHDQQSEADRHESTCHKSDR